jgi:hypothetical protein
MALTQERLRLGEVTQAPAVLEVALLFPKGAFGKLPTRPGRQLGLPRVPRVTYRRRARGSWRGGAILFCGQEVIYWHQSKTLFGYAGVNA